MYTCATCITSPYRFRNRIAHVQRNPHIHLREPPVSILTTAHRVRVVSPLLIALLAPVSTQAALIDISDVTITAFTSFSSQRVPKKTEFAERTAPPDQSFLTVNALIKEGLPFPNVPNSQNSGFASSAASIGGLFGVGVNGFHFENSLPPNDYSAAGTWKQSITNNSAFPVGTAIDFFIPAPTIRFFGVGDFFPPGRDPDLDATAAVELRLTTKLIHPNGSFVETVQFDYGMQAFRNPNSGAMEAVPSRDAVGELTRFDEFDGSFGFRLNVVVVHDPSYIDIGPGDRLEFGYDYLATAKTGFGETAVFAAIGDPFDLSLGQPFKLTIADVAPPPPDTGVPAPNGFALLALGLGALGLIRQRQFTNRRDSNRCNYFSATTAPTESLGGATPSNCAMVGATSICRTS